MNACSVPMPPGEIGTSVARLCVTWTRRTLRIDWSTPNASRKNQIADEAKESSRRPARRRRAEVLRAVAQDGEALADALLELVDVEARPEEPDRRRRSPGRRAARRRTPGSRRRSRSRSRAGCRAADAGQDAEGERVDEDDRRHRHVEDGETSSVARASCTWCRGRRGGRGRAGRRRRPGRDDRVHADAGEVGGIHRAPAHFLLGIGGGDRVPPGAARAHRLQQVADDRQPERRELDRGELSKKTRIAWRTFAHACRLLRYEPVGSVAP